VTRIPRRLDIALAIGVSVVSMQSAFDDGTLKRPAWAVIGLTLMTAIPLAFRRVRPVAVFAVTLAAAVGSVLVFDSFQVLGALIALYTVARYCDRTTSLGAVGAGVVSSVIPAVAQGSEDPLFAAVVGIGLVVVWTVGRRAGSREAELRAAHAAAAHAAELERARIARELHDVISHNVSVMVVQAAAGRDVFDSHPERAREALGAIEISGREALGELRRLLSVVREPDSEAPGELRAPQPGLERLTALADQVRGAGLDVRLDLDYRERSLPPGIDLSAFRVVQEALTNVLKHADASAAEVEIRQAGNRLEICVVDDGSGHARDGNGAAGSGLAGMRERVQLLGGRFTAGPHADGGFAIRASIPLDGGPR
jgi:signal transduction histidine kinase